MYYPMTSSISNGLAALYGSDERIINNNSNNNNNNIGYVTPRKLNSISVCLISMHMKYFFILYHINFSSTNDIPILWVHFYTEVCQFSIQSVYLRDRILTFKETVTNLV